MDKGATRALTARSRRSGIRSGADYTHRPREINEARWLPAGQARGRLPTSCRDKQPQPLANRRRTPRAARIFGHAHLAAPLRRLPHRPGARSRRIADALERIAPPGPAPADFAAADAFVWHAAGRRLAPVPKVNRVEMGLLRGIDRVRDTLADNTRRFARACRPTTPCSGARAAWASPPSSRRSTPRSTAERKPAREPFKLIEIHREDIESLPDLMAPPARGPAPLHRLLRRSLLRRDDTSYKSLKAVLEGGIEGPARERDLLRHLQPPPPDAARHDGERALDRDQSRRGGGGEGLAVRPLRPVARLPQLQPGRVPRHGLRLCPTTTASRGDRELVRAEALEWATTRGARSGRTAWQFIQDLAGRMGKAI